MMAEILRLNVVTTLDLQPDDILDAALGQYPGGVFVCGFDEDGHI